MKKNYKDYLNSGIDEAIPWRTYTDMDGVEINDEDIANGSPKDGDMIMRHPKSNCNRWLVSCKEYTTNYATEVFKIDKDKIHCCKQINILNTRMMNIYNDIKEFIVFESEDDFYYLQLLQRKKENPELGSNSRVIKNYLINSTEYLEKKMPEIISLCDKFNARAMLRLNKRSYRKVAFKAMINMSNSMANQEYKFVKKSYDRAIGQGHNDKNKKWILDIDQPYTQEYLSDVRAFINDVEPKGNKILKELPTKNGIHFITSPFNLQKFKGSFKDIEVHKDNPVNLYIK